MMNPFVKPSHYLTKNRANLFDKIIKCKYFLFAGWQVKLIYPQVKGDRAQDFQRQLVIS